MHACIPLSYTLFNSHVNEGKVDITQMKRLTATVIGLSGIGCGAPGGAPHASLQSQQPYSHVSAYVSVPEVELVGICDINLEAVERCRGLWGERLNNVQAYTNHREMLEKVKPDIVSVALPDHLHADVFIDCVDAGVKGIYCEKPLATTLADAKRMMEAVARSDVKVAVNHTRRWSPLFIRARQLIESGAIGDLLFVSAIIGGPRSMLFRNGTHVIDHILYFGLDRKPEWVWARLGDAFADYGPVYDGDGGHDPATDPDGNILIGLEDGVRAAYQGIRHSAVTSEWDIQGTKGRIRIENNRLGKVIGARVTRLDDDGMVWESNLHYEDYRSGLMAAGVRDLIQAVEGGGETLSTAETAFHTVAVMIGALQSNHEGRTITFPIADAPGATSVPQTG